MAPKHAHLTREGYLVTTLSGDVHLWVRLQTLIPNVCSNFAKLIRTKTNNEVLGHFQVGSFVLRLHASGPISRERALVRWKLCWLPPSGGVR